MRRAAQFGVTAAALAWTSLLIADSTVGLEPWMRLVALGLAAFVMLGAVVLLALGWWAR